MGFATSIKTNDLEKLTKKLDWKISQRIGVRIFEEALTEIESDEICIAETSNGSIILVGDDVPLFDSSIAAISDEKNRVIKFMYGETSMVFVFEYYEDGKFLREKAVVEYEVNFERGRSLEIEFSGLEVDEQINVIMSQVSGDDLNTIEPDHTCIRYKILDNVKDDDSNHFNSDKNIIGNEKKSKWKFW